MLLKLMCVRVILVSLVYLIFVLISYKILLDYEMVTVYECGFEINSLTRVPFSYRFFIVAILFIIFDVEIALMVPIPYVLRRKYIYILYIFLVVLLVGLLYEYYCGTLEWL